jgi:pimeloyl-ACP methyl ester carboxylesterase
VAGGVSAVAAVLGAPRLLPETTTADALPRRELARPASRFVRIDGVEVHHEVHGPAESRTAAAPPTLLLSHHFYGSTAVWDRLVPHLADVHRVVTWDRPGFGLTERPILGSVATRAPGSRADGSTSSARGQSPYTRRATAQLGWHLLDELGIDDAVLVGSSAGGSNVLEMYALAPDRVRALVLLAPAITGDVGPPRQVRALMRSGLLRRLGPRVIERLITDVSRERSLRAWHDPSRAREEDLAPYQQLIRVEGWSRGLWDVMSAEAPPDLRPVLRSVRVPTLVVTGAHDRTIAPRWGRWVAATIPGGRFALLPDCGHVPHQERPDELAAILRPFLAEVVGIRV